jgi:hypothetical protein
MRPNPFTVPLSLGEVACEKTERSFPTLLRLIRLNISEPGPARCRAFTALRSSRSTRTEPAENIPTWRRVRSIHTSAETTQPPFGAVTTGCTSARWPNFVTSVLPGRSSHAACPGASCTLSVLPT